MWKDVDLQMGVEAVAQVNAQLAKEGIYGVDDDKIRFRLRKAMTDLQRSRYVGLCIPIRSLNTRR